MAEYVDVTVPRYTLSNEQDEPLTLVVNLAGKVVSALVERHEDETVILRRGTGELQ